MELEKLDGEICCCHKDNILWMSATGYETHIAKRRQEFPIAGALPVWMERLTGYVIRVPGNENSRPCDECKLKNFAVTEGGR